MDFLYGVDSPEHPTAVVGVWVPERPSDMTPLSSTLTLLQDLRPWVEVVVLTQDARLHQDMTVLGVHIMSSYRLVRRVECRGVNIRAYTSAPLCFGACVGACVSLYGFVSSPPLMQATDQYPLVGSLFQMLQQHEPEALFYGLLPPSGLIHSDIVSSLHAVANAQAKGVLRPQVVAVGHTVVPQQAINEKAVAQVGIVRSSWCVCVCVCVCCLLACLLACACLRACGALRCSKSPLYRLW